MIPVVPDPTEPMDQGTRVEERPVTVAYALRIARATLRARAGARQPEDALEMLVTALDQSPVPLLMGASEVAQEVGVKVSNLRKVRGLPLPRQHLASGPVWLASEVKEFAADRRARKQKVDGNG